VPFVAPRTRPRNQIHTPRTTGTDPITFSQVAVALYSYLDIALDAATELVCVPHQSGSFHFRTTPVLPIRLTQHHRPQTEHPKSLHTLAYTLPSRPPLSPPSSSRCLVISAMPFRPQHSLVMIDVDKMHTIDTRSVEDLFGMWSGTNATILDYCVDCC
jgi:hypothetical protein